MAQALSLPKKETPNLLYRVYSGSFKNRDNADERKAALSAKGIESFIVPKTIDGVQYYRVQVGAYEKRENAENRVAELKKLGFPAFIESSSTDTPSNPPAEPPKEPGVSITGETKILPEFLNSFVRKVNPSAPYLGDLYVKLGEQYKIKGDIAFAQAVHETNYFRYTGVVQPDQNNYAGIGATGPNNRGATFDSPHEGVKAHIQHLYAYATTKPIPNGEEMVDPRFDLVTRGSANTWTGLNGKWAVPGDRYGQQILEVYNKIVNHTRQLIDLQQDKLNS